MKIFTLCAIGFLLQALPLVGQGGTEPVIYILSDNFYIRDLDCSYYGVLEDEDDKWSVEEVMKEPLSLQFHQLGELPDQADGKEIQTYWRRYHLQNQMNVTAEISLSAKAHYYDVYVVKPDSSPIHYRSGLYRKVAEKDGLKFVGEGAIPIKIPAGEELFIYDRLNKDDSLHYVSGLTLFGTNKLIEEKYLKPIHDRKNYYAKENLLDAFVFGLFLISIILNLVFYKIVREKVYLFFSMFLFVYGFSWIVRTLYVYAEWESPKFAKTVDYLENLMLLSPLFFILFLRQFFNIKAQFPKWDKTILILGFFSILTASVAIVLYSSEVLFGMNEILLGILFGSVFLCLFFLPISIGITLLLFIRKKDRTVRFFIAGSLPLILFYMYAIPAVLIIGEPTLENFHLPEAILASWLIISFSLILMMRFDRLQKENARQVLENLNLAREKEVEKNELIQKQKKDLEIQVAERTMDLEKSLSDLKSTQHQLIQSEKMASLGKLTASIAHEIQNPLNFVNNFSEVNSELIAEMKQEAEAGNLDEVISIADAINENEQKIMFHGKRADGIVKGMLQHSRISSGVKESTDINALVDEYLRLAYHGLRAKDKSFNASINTDFDTAIGLITVVPEDIGRVILNLITNAFYAVNKNKSLSTNSTTSYEPAIWVSTKKEANTIVITIRDNGTGIPQSIADKIFQPFFTTKPVGQGTGLGLSISYDIIKSHGGRIEVESKEGEGTLFIIHLPID